MTHSLSPESSLSGRILVVDDEPSVLAIAAAILNTIEVTPLKARTGEEAIATVQAYYDSGQKISLVVQDLTMPGGMSGFETMEALRNIDSSIRVIACSGFFEESALELCQSIGFSNILAKPYTPESLLSLIRRTLLEAPPPLPTKKQTISEPAFESPACFTPAASTTPIEPFSSFPSSMPQDDSDEDEEEPAYHSATHQTHFSPSAPASYQPTPHAQYPNTSTPTSVSERPQPESESSTQTPTLRRPPFLASALAKSIRSRLQPHHDPVHTSPTDHSAAAPLE